MRLRLYPRSRLLIALLTLIGLIAVPGSYASAGSLRATLYPQSLHGMTMPMSAASGARTIHGLTTTYTRRSCGSAPDQGERETILVPFVLGTTGVSTRGCYVGRVLVTVSGIGQAAGTQWSDAFYVFTYPNGHPKPPIHYGPPGSYYTFELWINGGPCDYYVQPIPPYHPDHRYTFEMTAPGGHLNFAVGDTLTSDNTGAYHVTVYAP